nr:O-antigen ligase family protein [Acidobacteriota bacterium]
MRYSRHQEDYEPVVRSRRGSSQRSEAVSAEVDNWLPRAVGSAGDDDNLSQAEQIPLAPNVSDAPKRAKPALRRGHALSYAGLFLFTLILYFRPYELFTSLSSFSSLAYWSAVATLAIYFPSQLALEGTLFSRPREVNLLLLFCLVALVGIPLASDRGEALDTFIDFVKAVMMFIVMVNVVRTERRLKGLIFLALAISCVLSIGAIYDYRLGRFTTDELRITGLVGGMFGNPNDMALHLVTMAPIAAALLLMTRNPLLKLFYGACVLLFLAGNVVTFSRGGFLGLIGAMGVLAWKMGRRRRVAIIVISLVLMAGFLAVAPSQLTSRFGGEDQAASGSASQRQQLLFRSILVSLRHPVLGVGMGNFHTYSIGEQVSHNAYTQVSAELGLAAMALYILFMVASLKRLRRIERETYPTRRDSRLFYLAVGLQASLIGFMISSFFASVAYQWYIYYLVGYAICLHSIYEAGKERVGEVEVVASAEVIGQKERERRRTLGFKDTEGGPQPVNG